MSIQWFIGRTGSGKSYGIVENIILPAIKQNREIWTNIPLYVNVLLDDFPDSNVTVFSNKEVNSNFLINIPEGAVIIIDEAWRFFSSGLEPDDDLTLVEFLAEHRHKVDQELSFSQEIVICSQTFHQIVKWVREQVDTTVVCKKADKVGMADSYVVRLFDGPTVRGQPVNIYYGIYKPEVYKYYKSPSKSKSVMPGLELMPDDRANVTKNPWIRYGLPISLAGGLIGLVSLYFVYQSFTHQNGIGDKKVNSQLAQSTNEVRQIDQNNENKPAINNQNNLKPSTIKPVEKIHDSKVWRIVGIVNNGSGSSIYLKRHGVKRYRVMNSIDCKSDSSGPICLIDGDQVTFWTGSDEPDKNSMLNNDKSTVSLSSLLPSSLKGEPVVEGGVPLGGATQQQD